MGIFSKNAKTKHTDPSCGMLVIEEEAIGPDTIEGTVYYFCSESCQTDFHEKKGTRMSRREQAKGRKERKEKVPA